MLYAYVNTKHRVNNCIIKPVTLVELVEHDPDVLQYTFIPLCCSGRPHRVVNSCPLHCPLSLDIVRSKPNLRRITFGAKKAIIIKFMRGIKNVLVHLFNSQFTALF